MTEELVAPALPEEFPLYDEGNILALRNQIKRILYSALVHDE